MEYSSKWNTHIKIGTLFKMEYSSKWNTHPNGTLILSKGIPQMEHPIKEPCICGCCLLDCLSTWEVVPSSNTLHSSFLSWFSGRMELSSSVCHGLSLKNIFLPSTRVFSLTQGSPPLLKLDFGLCARVFSSGFTPP